VGIITCHHLLLKESEYILPEATPNGYGKSGKRTGNLVIWETLSLEYINNLSKLLVFFHSATCWTEIYWNVDRENFCRYINAFSNPKAFLKWVYMKAWWVPPSLVNCWWPPVSFCSLYWWSSDCCSHEYACCHAKYWFSSCLFLPWSESDFSSPSFHLLCRLLLQFHYRYIIFSVETLEDGLMSNISEWKDVSLGAVADFLVCPWILPFYSTVRHSP